MNGRALRFPAPFGYTGSAPEPADLVLGQQNFTTTITDPSSTNLAVPYGLAFSPSCNTPTQACPAPNGLLVSDEGDNRVLYFPTTNGTFVGGTDNGKAATIVFGQSSFNSTGNGSAATAMYGPHHISCDMDGATRAPFTTTTPMMIRSRRQAINRHLMTTAFADNANMAVPISCRGTGCICSILSN